MNRQSLQIPAFVAILLCGTAWRSAAQAIAPYGGTVAIGASAGGAVPIGDRLENGLYTGGNLSIALASQVALTAEVGANWLDVDGPGLQTHLMPRFADLDLVIHLRRGPFRPFVTGGVGVYRYTLTVSSAAFADPTLRTQLTALGLTPASRTSIESRHDEIGVNFGGGFEYFFSRRSALLMDGRVHASQNFVQVAPFKGVFVNASIGFRQYF